jgi:uncharacterized protein (DUF1697 family)
VTTYVALLRAVNVGGRTVPMAELRRAFEDMGYEDVRTYIQSGNVVFGASGSATSVAAQVRRGLEAELGPEVGVVLSTPAQLGAVVRRNPLARHDPATLHVTFLGSTPPGAKMRALEPDGYAPDVFHIAGRHVYLHCPNGYGRTKLTNALFERKLGVMATTRNVRTVTTLAAM